MIVTAVQSMQTFIVGQTRSRAEARTRKIDGYRYSYTLGGISPEEMTLDEACSVIDCVLFDVMHTGEIKDMEVTEEASSPLFSFRFFSKRRLEKSYAIELLWIDRDIETDTQGNPIIIDDTPLYGKDEIPENLESLMPICVDVIEIQ